jgi:SSS family solute:Na+ symporter
MAKYVKANPATGQVVVTESPSDSTIQHWPSGAFMLALYDDDVSINRTKIINPYVLPINKTAYTQTGVDEFTVFNTEDKSWHSVFPQLAEEVRQYNENVKHDALAAKKQVTSEKFIAFKYDTAMGHLLAKVLPQGVGLLGFVLAALLGAVVSSLAAMLNASSTIFTMDVVKKYFVPQASHKIIVMIGRISVVVFSFIAVMLAPQLGNPKISNSIFTIIQEGQGFISPGILAVFVFGLIVRKAPPVVGVVGLLMNIASYGIIKYFFPHIQFLNRMAICFGLCILIMSVITFIKPLDKPIEFKHQTNLDLTSSRGARIAGLIVVAVTLLLYVIFSPLGIAK